MTDCSSRPLNRTLCVAPMMDWTDRHCRYFHRLLAPNALLYTEMVTAGAVRFGSRDKLLGFDPFEQPVALQIGGSDPDQLAYAARVGEDMGYAEINLNVGCPSDRVQSGRFGACLMREPMLVAECVGAMKATVKVPVTVKCRLGIDEQSIEAPLSLFVEGLTFAGVDALIVHARKAWLSGLSPKENREKPPLNYGRVLRLKQEFPALPIVLNGGLTEFSQIETALETLDGVMLGRVAYHEPYCLAEFDAKLFGSTPLTREAALQQMADYVVLWRAKGLRLHAISKHLLGLYHGCWQGKAWRRWLSEGAQDPNVGPELLHDSLKLFASLKEAA
jgi:tRNA-dihydrouridine synthase A